MNVKITVKATTPLISVKKAQEILDTTHYDRQRYVSPNKVSQYVRDIQAGHFFPGTPVEICTHNGKGFLTNGQHRLESLIKSGCSLQFTLISRLFEGKLTEVADEIGRLYGVTDSGKGRSWADYIRSTGVSDSTEVPASVINPAGSCMTYINTGFKEVFGLTRLRDYDQTRHEKTQAILEWKDEIKAYYDSVGLKPSIKRLYTAPVMSVGLVLMRHCKERASKFFNQISENDGLIKGSPQHTLHSSMLLSTIIAQHGGVEYSHKVAKAWNSYFDAEDVKSGLVTKRCNDGSLSSIILKGTPYDGKS